jgi:hypothetical protein
MKKRTTKPRSCRRCNATIRPDHDAHTTVTMKIRDCWGNGDWREEEYHPFHVCAVCWAVVDAAFAVPGAEVEEDRACSSCGGSGRYDVEGGPPCGGCDGTGREPTS